ncbi:MAG: DUF1566 domain-containing protein [Bacteroidota bacterium]
MQKTFLSILLAFSIITATAQTVGIGTNTPEPSALLDLSSTTKGFLPPRVTTAQRDSIANPVEGLQVFNTTTKCIEAYIYGYWQAVFCGQPKPIDTGDLYQGGIIAYILTEMDAGYDPNVQHGIIAATTDLATTAYWYNGILTATGVTDTTIGAGTANTNAIVLNQGDGNYAAKLCYDLLLNGYDDWVLPTKAELNKLYNNRTIVGGFQPSKYWSSSEVDANFAWVQDFGLITNNQGSGAKATVRFIRPVRYF